MGLTVVHARRRGPSPPPLKDELLGASSQCLFGAWLRKPYLDSIVTSSRSEAPELVPVDVHDEAAGSVCFTVAEGKAVVEMILSKSSPKPGP